MRQIPPPVRPPQLRTAVLVVPILKLVKLCARSFASQTHDPISTILKSGKSKMIFSDFKIAFKKSNQSENVKYKIIVRINPYKTPKNNATCKLSVIFQTLRAGRFGLSLTLSPAFII